MHGVITRRHFFQIARAFGVRKALRVLLSRRAVALGLLFD